jgi:hypothetical protein
MDSIGLTGDWKFLCLSFLAFWSLLVELEMHHVFPNIVLMNGMNNPKSFEN